MTAGHSVAPPGWWHRGAAAIAAALCFALQGCDIGYLTRGAYEEARLLWKRRPIAGELKKEDLAPEVRAKLELVLAVREFARDKLGLNVGGAYATVSPVDQGAVTWVVMAAPRASLQPYTWWFPIVGSVPYRGYFNRSDALVEAAKLEAAGYDTFVRSAVAFSSLGYFDDPLLSNLLRLRPVELAGVLIHELFHRTYFLPGAVMFNESAATWVGGRGAIEFFTATQGEASAEASQAREIAQSDLRFAAFLKSQEARLLKLYDSGEPEDEILGQRGAVFAQIQADYAALKPQLSGLERFDLDRIALNNAVLLNYRLYFHDLDEFAAVDSLNHHDLRTTIQAIIEIAEASPSDPFFGLWQAAQEAPSPPP